MHVCTYVRMYVYVVLFYDVKHVGTTTVEGPGVVIYHPGVTVLPIELTCDVSPGVGWVVNSTSYLLNELQSGSLAGHNISGRNILIMVIPMNNSQYVCSDGINNGGVYHIVVAGELTDLFVGVYIYML